MRIFRAIIAQLSDSRVAPAHALAEIVLTLSIRLIFVFGAIV